MAWLLFVDESGHDHRSMPYEVRGGVALHASRVWPFVQAMEQLEIMTFGVALRDYKVELKGSRLLGSKRFRHARQGPPMPLPERTALCRSFLRKGKSQTRKEFTAYGQACIDMATGVFKLLRDHQAKLLAAAIPRDCAKPETDEAEAFLRKDQVFLLERYYYLLDQSDEHGLIITDRVERNVDQQFVGRLQRYFRRTDVGRQRARCIVPTPFFVPSDMTYPVQAADIAIYCVNWGFRLPSRGMDAAVREEIAGTFGPWLRGLQYRGRGHRGGDEYDSFGIVYVPDPYEGRAAGGQ